MKVTLPPLFSMYMYSFPPFPPPPPLSLFRLDGTSMPMRVRSMVGLIPLFACLVLEDEVIQKLSGFRKRLKWFLDNRKDLAKQVRHTNTC